MSVPIPPPTARQRRNHVKFFICVTKLTANIKLISDYWTNLYRHYHYWNILLAKHKNQPCCWSATVWLARSSGPPEGACCRAACEQDWTHGRPELIKVNYHLLRPFSWGDVNTDKQSDSIKTNYSSTSTSSKQDPIHWTFIEFSKKIGRTWSMTIILTALKSVAL